MTHQSDRGPNDRGMGVRSAYGVEPSNRKYKLRLARYKALAEEVAAFIDGKRAKTMRFALLDIGAGSGRSMRFIEHEGVADVIDFHGFDLRHERLDSIYRPDRWRLVQGDIQQGACFDTGCFDIVIFEQVLEHMENPHTVLEEIARMLRPGGLLILGAPTFPWGISHLRSLLVGVAKAWFGMNRSHVQSFDRSSLHHLVCARDAFTINKSYGFRIISGGVFSFIEDYLWWYRINRWLGRIMPGLCTEIQIIATRNGDSERLNSTQ